MKTAPSEELQGVAEEIVEVEIDENKIIGDPNVPNKDTNTHGLSMVYLITLKSYFLIFKM